MCIRCAPTAGRRLRSPRDIRRSDHDVAAQGAGRGGDPFVREHHRWQARRRTRRPHARRDLPVGRAAVRGDSALGCGRGRRRGCGGSARLRGGGVGKAHRARARPAADAAGRGDHGASGSRARGTRKPRHRQAAQAGQGRCRRGGALLRVLRLGRRQGTWRDHSVPQRLHGRGLPRAARRNRPCHPVELSGADFRPLGRGFACDGQRLRGEAGRGRLPHARCASPSWRSKSASRRARSMS